MVPKIIHCCWFGGPKTKLAEKCLASWRKFAPDWEIREWDEGQTRAKWRDLPGFAFFEAAIAAGKWAMASDWVRMSALFGNGGVYLDLDVELIAPMDDLPDGEWVAGEWTASGDVWMNPGGGIALRKESDVARLMLDAYEGLVFDPKREMMPWINARLSKSGVRVLDPRILSPIDVDGRMRSDVHTIGVHHYAMSWASPKQRVLQWMSWHGMRPIINAMLHLRRMLMGRKHGRISSAEEKTA